MLRADPDAAKKLGETLLSKRDSQEALRGWLSSVASFPLDLDRKAQAKTSDQLKEIWPEHGEKLRLEIQDASVCQSATRHGLISGKPFRYLDRMGARAPKRELERDLDTMGLALFDVLVNCYHGDQPGFFLIVSPSPNGEKIRAFWN